MSSTCFQPQFVVGNNKPNHKMFFVIEIYYLQLRPQEFTSTNVNHVLTPRQ
jgi:hypothetical protein